MNAHTPAVSAQPMPLAETVTASRSERRSAQYLFHPLVDFLCLGGASLVVLPIAALWLSAEAKPAVLLVTMILANFVNHPHFANSYQVFYRQFRRKAFGPEYPPALRVRYLVAGVGVPLALLLFFGVCLMWEDSRMLALGVNLMGLLVGWHYAKQGYGMLILDSVLKRSFFRDDEKTSLLWNAYACWMASWVVANRSVIEHKYWGLEYAAVPIPDAMFYAVLAAAVVTTTWALSTLTRKALAPGGRVPVNGIMAYVVTLYVWLVFVRALGPLVMLIVPLFHSLQYLIVVWRYQLNWERSRVNHTLDTGLAVRPHRRLARFVGASVMLGFIGFWLAPVLLDSLRLYDAATFGSTMFLFLFWIFINVHHYFLDSVVWRRENPDTRKYLFV